MRCQKRGCQGFSSKFSCAFFPNPYQSGKNAHENCPASGSDSGRTVARGLEHFLARCVSWASGNTGLSHAAPPRAPGQGSFPGAELRKGF